ncbi:MAG: methyltransferase domain-containing protein [Gemmatimonadota bacterium]|nr:methyltransferase domain-containing protein [Gemmatimonadota bacterium]
MSPLAGSTIGEELLDDPTADPAAVRLSLANLARANALFGGWWTVRTGLKRLLKDAGNGTLSLLDVGTGAGDLAGRARRWAGRQGNALKLFGVDQHSAAARMATQVGVPSWIGCGSVLPLADRSVDLVLLSQVAHHLAPASLQQLVREITRVSRIGVVLADLRPSRIAGAAYRLTGPLLRFDDHTVTDGIISLRRGFTPARLAAELQAAGVTPWIRADWGVRIVAVWRSDGRPA